MTTYRLLDVEVANKVHFGSGNRILCTRLRTETSAGDLKSSLTYSTIDRAISLVLKRTLGVTTIGSATKMTFVVGSIVCLLFNDDPHDDRCARFNDWPALACKSSYLSVVVNAQIVLSLLHIPSLKLCFDRVTFE